MNKLFFIIIFSFSFLFCDDQKVSENKKKRKINVIPILGQIQNEEYLKASVLAGMQSYAIYKFIDYNNNEQIAKRNTYAWWSLGLYFYGIIDAYVDYNLKNFPKENNDNDE